MCTYPNILLSSTFACCLIFPFLHLVDLLLDIRFYIWNIQHFSKKWMRMPLLKVSIHYSSCCVVFSIYLCVENVPFMWFIWLSQFDDAEQLFSSYFIAATVTAAIAALCCSIVPPLSRIRILFRVAIGQPDALKTINHVSALIIKKFISFLLKFIQWIFNKMNLRCDKNFPVEWPEPSLKWEIGKKRKQSKFKIMWNGNSKLVFLKFESSYNKFNISIEGEEIDLPSWNWTPRTRKVKDKNDLYYFIRFVNVFSSKGYLPQWLWFLTISWFTFRFISTWASR